MLDTRDVVLLDERELDLLPPASRLRSAAPREQGEVLATSQIELVGAEDLRAAEPAQARDALQARLGLRIAAVSTTCKVNAPAAAVRNKRRPGIRRPQRDRIGVAANAVGV